MDEPTVRTIAAQVYQTLSRTPANVQTTFGNPLAPQFANTSNGATGFLSPTNTVGQTVNTNSPGSATNATPFVLPIPIVYGGGGSHASFNGGAAPTGTIALFFNNNLGTLTIQLWVRLYDQSASAQKWYGMDFSPGNASGHVQVLGPKS